MAVGCEESLQNFLNSSLVQQYMEGVEPTVALMEALVQAGRSCWKLVSATVNPEEKASWDGLEATKTFNHLVEKVLNAALSFWNKTMFEVVKQFRDDAKLDLSSDCWRLADSHMQVTFPFTQDGHILTTIKAFEKAGVLAEKCAKVLERTTLMQEYVEGLAELFELEVRITELHPIQFSDSYDSYDFHMAVLLYSSTHIM